MPGRRQPIRALLVDYGEVLCSAPNPATFAEMARVADVEPGLFGDAYWRLRPPYDRRELDGPAYWRLLGQETGVDIDATRAAELLERDVALWSQLDGPMLAWANDLARTEMPVGLLSNMVPEIGIHLRDTLRVFDEFTTVTYSCDVGFSKPDPRIYRHALESVGALAHETLFVDDRMPNVEAADALGIHAHHFVGRDELVGEIERRYTFV